MKKILLTLICLTPFLTQAQTAEFENRSLSEAEMQRLRELFDTKMYHDATFVKYIVRMMRDGAYSPNDVNYGVIFSEKDATLLKDKIFNRKANNLGETNLEELDAQIDANPFEAFMTFIEGYKIPKMTRSDMQAIGGIDSKAISDFLIMATEAGPEVGSGTVSAVYTNNIE